MILIKRLLRKSPYSQIKKSNVYRSADQADLGKLKLEFLREIVEGMVNNGQAEWSGKGPRVQALLYWLNPEEWANMLSNWVSFFEITLTQIDETGQKNTVLTLYELSQGDLANTEGWLLIQFTNDRFSRNGPVPIEKGTPDLGEKGRCDYAQECKWGGDRR